MNSCGSGCCNCCCCNQSSEGEPQELLQVTDTESVDLTINNILPQTLAADVNISDDDGNTIEIRDDGLYSAGSDEGTLLLVADTDSVDLTINGSFPQTLTADVEISADVGNIIEIRDDGLFAEGGDGSLLLVTDTESVNLTINGTLPQTLTADVFISDDVGNLIEIRVDGLYAAAGDGGIIDVTTAELNTLISGSDLLAGRTYRVTDHVQGRVPASTKVVVQALSATQITSQCQVLTSYDPTYWRGVYDVTTNKLLELRDNLGNTCRQFPDIIFGPFTCVDDFDWGNPAITNCLVDNATWTTDYGLTPTFGITGLKLTDAAFLDTTGWLGEY